MDEEKKVIRGRPFKKGESGNPKGRPKKGETWKEIYERVLDEASTENPEISIKEAIARSSATHAIEDPRFLKLVQERMEGKPPQEIQNKNYNMNVDRNGLTDSQREEADKNIKNLFGLNKKPTTVVTKKAASKKNTKRNDKK